MSTGTILSPSPARPRATQPLAAPFLNGDILYEVVDNEIRELPPMSARETQLASNLAGIVGNHAWNPRWAGFRGRCSS